MKIYFTSPVRHDGKHFGVNDSVDLDKDQAMPLIEAGVATTQKPAKDVIADAQQEPGKAD